MINVTDLEWQINVIKRDIAHAKLNVEFVLDEKGREPLEHLVPKVMELLMLLTGIDVAV